MREQPHIAVDWMPQAIVVVPGELPNGEIAHVQLKPRGLDQSFIILSALHLDLKTFMRTRTMLRAYSLRHSEDTGHVEFSLFPDGRLETRSDARGFEVGTYVPTREQYSGDDTFAADLQTHLALVADSDFPGFGRARIVDFSNPRRR